jgi:hypothetical protein
VTSNDISQKAKEILGNEAVRAAFAAMRDQILHRLLACTEKQDEERYRLQIAYSVVSGVEKHLAALAMAGPDDEQPDLSDIYNLRSQSKLKAFLGL